MGIQMDGPDDGHLPATEHEVAERCVIERVSFAERCSLFQGCFPLILPSGAERRCLSGVGANRRTPPPPPPPLPPPPPSPHPPLENTAPTLAGGRRLKEEELPGLAQASRGSAVERVDTRASRVPGTNPP